MGNSSKKAIKELQRLAEKRWPKQAIVILPYKEYMEMSFKAGRCDRLLKLINKLLDS